MPAHRKGRGVVIVYNNAKKTEGLPFQGELMVCILCGKQKKSDPAVESGWTHLDFGGMGIYFCPDHLPGAGATRQDHQRAYEKIFDEIKRKLG